MSQPKFLATLRKGGKLSGKALLFANCVPRQEISQDKEQDKCHVQLNAGSAGSGAAETVTENGKVSAGLPDLRVWLVSVLSIQISCMIIVCRAKSKLV